MDDATAGRSNLAKAESGPKYKRIYARLREMVADSSLYQAGDKLPSENEFVEHFGASRPTVGRALAQLESEGLVQRRAGSGTYVSERSEHSGYVFGLLIPDLGITEIFEPICQGISRARLGGHHDLLWGPTFDKGAAKEAEAERLCEYFVKRKVTGVFFAPLELMSGKDATNRRIGERLNEAKIPVVLLDRDICDYPQRSQYDLVGIDNQRAGYVITEHLLTSGSERVVFFAHPESAPTVHTRLMGYASAMRSHMGRALQEMVEFGDGSDADLVRDMIARCRPDAVVCANDRTAAQLMTTLYAIGTQVPSEVRIAGIDDVKYASMLQVPLTTIHQPCGEIGAAALMAMLDRVAHPDAPARDLLVNFKLCVRQSTFKSTPAAASGLPGVAEGR